MNELNLSEIEKETRYLVDLVNQNPMAFVKNEAGIPAIPLEIAILAQNFAADKDRRAVQAYELWLTNAPNELWQPVTYNGQSDVYMAQIDLQGLSPANVHSGFIQAIQKHSDKLPNLIQLTDDLQHRRQLFGEYAVASAIPMTDYRNVVIFESERQVQNRMKTLVEDVQELNRPKTDLELELDAIREEYSNEHSDIIIEPGTYKQIEQKPKKRIFAGKTQQAKDNVQAKLESSLQRLLDRLDSPDVTPEKKWITATVPFKAYNVLSNYKYSSENAAFAELYCQEAGWETGCFISPKEAFERGFSVPKGTETNPFVQRFPIDVPAHEMINGQKVPKLKEDGTPDTYRIYGMGYSLMFNIDQLEWKDSSRPDPRIKWKEAYKGAVEPKPCNQENLEIMRTALMDLGYVKIETNHSQNAYSPSTDTIYLRNIESFRNVLRFNHTLLHELAHATGHPDRLARPEQTDYHLDVAMRGKEELIANRVSALLIEHYGLHNSELGESYSANNEVYDLGWAKKAYEKDPMLIMDTLGSAQHAFNTLRPIIDKKLEQMNVLELFQEEKVNFGEKPKADPELKAQGTYKTNKPSYKRRMTV